MVDPWPWSDAGCPVGASDRKWSGLGCACSKQAIFFEVQADGSLKAVDDTGYVDLDPSIIPSSSS